MSTFVDTSALLALLNASDEFHGKADAAWRSLLARDERLVTSSYVLVESFALLQSRLGLEAVRVFHEDVIPVLQVVWIDDTLHATSAAALLTAGRRDVSLVDCASFECMRRLGLKKAFAFDKHFSEQGFELVR